VNTALVVNSRYSGQETTEISVHGNREGSCGATHANQRIIQRSNTYGNLRGSCSNGVGGDVERVHTIYLGNESVHVTISKSNGLIGVPALGKSLAVIWLRRILSSNNKRIRGSNSWRRTANGGANDVGSGGLQDVENQGLVVGRNLCSCQDADESLIEKVELAS